MKNIRQINIQKHSNSSKYKYIEDGIYKDLIDPDETNHRIAISFDLEVNEDTQYPLEDILDKFHLHVSDFLKFKSRSKKEIKLELAGELGNIRRAKTILGKRVYNRQHIKNGKPYAELVIE